MIIIPTLYFTSFATYQTVCVIRSDFIFPSSVPSWSFSRVLWRREPSEVHITFISASLRHAGNNWCGVKRQSSIRVSHDSVDFAGGWIILWRSSFAFVIWAKSIKDRRTTFIVALQAVGQDIARCELPTARLHNFKTFAKVYVVCNGFNGHFLRHLSQPID